MPVSTYQARTVFISYAREDEHLILPVAHLLRAAGAVVFLDQEDIPYGEQWESVLLEQLQASERILVFWSINAAKSPWVRREYLIAIEAGLRVVPIPIDATPLSTELATFQALTSLVPLVYQLQQGRAPRVSWRRSRGMALIAVVFPAIIGLAIYARTYAQVSQAAPEGPGSQPSWPQAGVWALGILGMILFISFTRFWTPLPVQLEVQDLQAAIYSAVFGQDPSGEDA